MNASFTRPFLLFVISACLFLTFPSQASKQIGEIKPEIHLVSVYEGARNGDSGSDREEAAVHVDRPGRRVILVLAAYSSTTWQISVSPETCLEKIILGGYEPQSVEGAEESVEIVKAWSGQQQPTLYYSYEPASREFRQLVRGIHQLTGLDVSSAQGCYRAKLENPFVVDRVQNDLRLSADYPKPKPSSELPADAARLSYDAHRYAGAGVAVSFGRHTITGPFVQNLATLPVGVARAAHDSHEDQHYGISGHDIVKFDIESGETERISPTDDELEISWPCEIVYDSKRRRIVVATSSGRGQLFAYTPSTREWSLIGARPGALDAFAYSEPDDSFYGLLFDGGEGGAGASLVRMNWKGIVTARLPLGPPVLPEFLHNGPGVCGTQVAVAGKYIVILASPRHVGGDGEGGHVNNGSPSVIYLVDPEENKIWLTSKVRSGQSPLRGSYETYPTKEDDLPFDRAEELTMTDIVRNPFGVEDIENPDGPDVLDLAARMILPGDANDANAESWAEAMTVGSLYSIEGEWSERWNSGGGDWSYGKGPTQIKVANGRVYMLIDSSNHRFLVDLRRDGNRLIGRYRGIEVPGDTGPCVFRIVSDGRIDGSWSGVGRWDLRRKIEGKSLAQRREGAKTEESTSGNGIGVE